LVRVKICGITNLEDAIASVIAGCDALGFVFYKKSPRYITPEKAEKIIRLIPKDISKVGVFVNALERDIREIARKCKLDLLQFHGDESPEFCCKFKPYKVIKAFRVKDKIDSENILRHKTFAYLFDAFAKTKFGGTGKAFNWRLLKNIRRLKQKIFLSGGLNTQNVKEALKIVHPQWVDVSSSVEIRPGKKDHKKVKQFIETIKTSQRRFPS